MRLCGNGINPRSRAFIEQRSVKHRGRDSWVSRVSCNTDECFPCTDTKLQTHKPSAPHSLYLEFQMLHRIISFRFWSVYLMAVSESVCDHSSVGENTLQTCHWPIWLHFHVASFGDSSLFKSGGVLWLQPVSSRAVCFWGVKLFFWGLCLKNHSERNKDEQFKRGFSNNHSVTKIAQSRVGNSKETLHVTPSNCFLWFLLWKKSPAVVAEMGWHALWSVSD